MSDAGDGEEVLLPIADDPPTADEDELPDNAPDDWLEQKPFDPAGR